MLLPVSAPFDDVGEWETTGKGDDSKNEKCAQCVEVKWGQRI